MLQKLMRFLMILIVAVTLIISGCYIGYYSFDIKHDLYRSSEVMLKDLYAQVSLLYHSIDALSLQISLDTQVNQILNNPFQADILEYRNIKEQLLNQIAANQVIQSIYLYFKLDGRVLTTTEGMYKLEDFYDQALIEEAEDLDVRKESMQIRTLRDPVTNRRHEWLTITKPLPLTSKQSLGTLVINVKQKEFLELAYEFSRLDAEKHPIFLLDRKTGNVIFGPNHAGLTSALSQWSKDGLLDAPGGFKARTFNGKTYFVSYVQFAEFPWTAMMLIPRETYASEFWRKAADVGKVNALVLSIGFILSFVFSRRFVQPWRTIINSCRNGTFHLQDKDNDETVIDETVIVQQTIAGLMEENKAFKEALEQTLPVVRSRLIYDLLTDSAADRNTAGEIREFGIVFPHPHYLALLVSCDLRAQERAEDYINLKSLLFSYIESSLKQHWFVIGTILEGSNFGFIINLDSDVLNDSLKATLKHTCNGIIEQSLDRFNVLLQFSFGDLCDSLEKVHMSYFQAKRVTHCKALLSATDVVFYQDIEYDPSVEYPLELHNELNRCLMSCNMEKANQTLETFIKTYVDNMEYSREAIQEIVILLISGIMRNLYEQGFPLSRTGYRAKSVFDLQNREDLKAFLRGFVNDVASQMESCQNHIHDNIYLLKALEFMEQNYRDIESVSDIAAHVGISNNYLGRIFREELGKSPLDMLTKIRIEKSKQLLSEVNRKYSLQEICNLIGYHDVKSFIRFFKKLENMTPGEYRKMILSANRTLERSAAHEPAVFGTSNRI